MDKTKLTIVKVNGKDKLVYVGKGSFSAPLSTLDLFLADETIVTLKAKNQ